MECECGCGQLTSRVTFNKPASGLKIGDYHRFVKGHHQRQFHQYPLVYRAESGCLLWRGTISKKGYGVFRFPFETYPLFKDIFPSPVVTAHKLHFWIEYGRLPVGHLDHTCEVKHCVEPTHLVDGSRFLNSALGFVSCYLRELGCKYDPEKMREGFMDFIEGILREEAEDDDE